MQLNMHNKRLRYKTNKRYRININEKKHLDNSHLDYSEHLESE